MVNIDFCLTKRSLETFQLEKMVSTKEVKKNSPKWQQSRRDCKSMKQVFNIFKESKISRSIKSLYEVRGEKPLDRALSCFESIDLVTGLVQNLELATGSFGT